MSVLWQDTRLALRNLRHAPGFTVLVLLTLGVGIGATTAMFSAVNQVLLRPLPFAAPDRLVMLWDKNEQRGWEHVEASPANALDWRERVTYAALERDDWEILFSVFSTTDRVQHMMYKFHDEEHPKHDAEEAARVVDFFGQPTALKDVIPAIYKQMDRIVGKVMDEHLGPNDTLLLCADHGFTSYRRGMHVNNWLAEKGYDRDVAEQAVQKLTDDGLQSDQRFAESFVQSRINQGKGPVRIRLELGQRGVTDAVVEFAIEESAADWHGLARDVRSRKFGLGEPADFQAKAKQMRFLQYRGFEQDHIQSAF